MDDDEFAEDDDISGMLVLPPHGCPSNDYDFNPEEDRLAA
jgi:hypothetical protein